MASDAERKAESLSPDDWARIAQWVRSEYENRKTRRAHKEAACKEVDRQIRMEARQALPSERRPQWYPNVEVPGQFNALEVNMADVRRLTFPRAGSWYKSSAAITDKYRERWDTNRLKMAMVGDVPLEMMLDQETADILVKQTLEHYHRMYDFKGAILQAMGESLKYGDGIVQVKKLRDIRFAHHYRGEWSEQTVGPKVIPCSWWHTYLDDSWSALLHEGTVIGPTVIRWIGSQPLDDLKAAINQGGADLGYRMPMVNLLKGKVGGDEQKGRVELLECEGDVLVWQTTGSILLPNVTMTVAMGEGGADVIRFRKNPMPFRSYVVFPYFKHDLKSAYADSPLIKGVPTQQIATWACNDFLAVSRLRALPPVAYDANDPRLTAAGGPQIYPQAQWPSEAPNATEAIEVGDPGAALQAFLAFVKLHEDTTGSTEARRGQRLKSHTTAYAADVEASQGISRTEDFVSDCLAGSLPTILHMEYEIAKDSMKSPQNIRIDAEGIDGWVSLQAKDLADIVEFECVGAEGNIEQQQKAAAFTQFITLAAQVAPLAAQLGIPVPINYEALLREAAERYGITNVTKYIGPVATIEGGAASESIVPGLSGGLAPEANGAASEEIPPEGSIDPGPAINGSGLPVGFG